MEYVSPEGLRQDGRRPKELRNLSCELHPLPTADGSAIFQIGNTKVLAAVFGPRTADIRGQAHHDRALVKCEYAEAAFSTGTRHRRRGRGNRRNTELAATVRAALEQTILVDLFPRAQIDVSVQVLRADGSVLSACINAAMLAAADAGVPLRDMVAAVSAGYLAQTHLLDMNHNESSARGCSELVLAMHPNLAKVIILQVDRIITPENLEAAAELAEQGCRAVGKFMRAQLLAHAQTIAAVRGLGAQ